MDEITVGPGALVERVAALDIGKASLVCCVRVPHEDKPGARRQEVRTYATVTPALLALWDWLTCPALPHRPAAGRGGPGRAGAVRSNCPENCPEGVIVITPVGNVSAGRSRAACRNRTDDLFITSDRRRVGRGRMTWVEWALTCEYSDPAVGWCRPESDAVGSPFGSPG
jgi:hypothetical protein